MNEDLPKEQTRCSRVTSFTATQAKLPAGAEHKGAEIPLVRTARRGRLSRPRVQQPRFKEAEQKATETQQLKSKPATPGTVRSEQVSPATRLRKRQVSGDGNGDGDNDQLQRKRARLTQKNLALFNKMGMKKASSKASASAPPDSMPNSSSSKALSTTSSGFALRALRNGILGSLESKPPTNLEDIREQYARSRATASPSESRFRRYARTVSIARNEATTVDVVSRYMLKEHDDDGYQRAFNRAFTAFPKDVGLNDGLAIPKPDFVEGLGMQKYDPFPIDEHVSGAVLYRDDPYSVTLPHLAAEWKGPDGSMAEATRQSAYAGAALVYARNQALSLIGKPDPPGHAKVTTFTTNGTNVNFYAHYATPSKDDGRLKYHQYQYASANVKDTYQGHLDGRKGIRNGQDHARDQSYAVRDQLKKHWKQRYSGLHTNAERAPPSNLDDVPEESLPVQESNSCTDRDDERDEPPSAKPTHHKRKSRKAPPACRTEDDPGYKLIDIPSYAPTPPRSVEERRRANTIAKNTNLRGHNLARDEI